MNISIIVTTYADKIKFAKPCLESIGNWKQPHHELIVVCHDANDEMYKFLVENKKIDKLIFSPHNHGHLRGVNLGVASSKHPVFFNICHDMIIGPDILDYCGDLIKDKTGIVGWHWRGNGVFWHDLYLDYTIREKKLPDFLINPMEKAGFLKILIESPWFWTCNTSFFGMRKTLWEKIKGFNTDDFQHGYADDFLTYAVLNKGFNSVNIPEKYYNPKYFDSLTRCFWHRIGIERAKKNTHQCLVKFL